MATTTKKGSKNTKAKPRRAAVKSPPKRVQTIPELRAQLEARDRELAEAREQQTPTSEVLGIISRSPTDVQPVLDAIVESAARVCGVDDVLLRLREGDASVSRAHFGPIASGRTEVSINEPQYRWMREHGALHILDIRAQNEFPSMGSLGNFRTILAAPLRQQGELIGAFIFARIIWRGHTKKSLSDIISDLLASL